MTASLLSRKLIQITAVLVFTISCLFAPSEALAQDNPKRVWTVAEVLDERQTPVRNPTPRYCQGAVFKPCVCARDVSKLAQYRPAVKECNGKAAIVLSGKYLGVFSVVVRDRENKDRWPTAGANGCTPFERDTLALNKCSVFKVQKIIQASDAKGEAKVHCLGASGYSSLFSRVTRMTAKLADVPNSTNDPLVRWCIIAPDKALN